MSKLKDAIEARARAVKEGQAVIDAANEAATEATPEEVVFYAWTDAGTQSMPSSLTMRIGGGERVKDAESGRIMTLAYQEVRFNMGILRSSDPNVIREIRKAIKKGDTITEDKEVFLAKVEKPELRAQRLERVRAADKETLKKQEREIADLKAKLAAVGQTA